MPKSDLPFSTELPIAITDPTFEYVAPGAVLTRVRTQDGEIVFAMPTATFMRSINVAMDFVDKNLGSVLADTIR